MSFSSFFKIAASNPKTSAIGGLTAAFTILTSMFGIPIDPGTQTSIIGGAVALIGMLSKDGTPATPSETNQNEK